MWKFLYTYLLLLVLPFALLSQAQRGGTLVVGMAEEAKSLDPAHGSPHEGGQIVSTVFERLVRHVPGTKLVQGELAREWKISADGRVYTFLLSPGVRFHDGIELTAADVVFSLRRQFDRNNPYYQYGPWQTWSWLELDDLVTAITAVDRSTVEIVLSEPYAPFLEVLSMDFASIVSFAAVQKYGADFSMHPVGTGPFRFVSWKPGYEISLMRNRNYWKDPPYLDRLVFRLIADDAERLSALRQQEVDMITSPPAGLSFDTPADAAITLTKQAVEGISFLAINTQRVRNNTVRKSIALAVDGKALLAAIGQDAGQLAASVLPSLAGSDSSFVYDPVIAAALLTSANYSQDQVFTLYIPAQAMGGLSQPGPIARELKKQLEWWALR